MNIKTVIFIFLASFTIFCGVLVFDSGLFEPGQDKDADSQQKPVIMLASETAFESTKGVQDDSRESEQRVYNQHHGQSDFTNLQAVGGRPKTITLGSQDPASGYKFQLELSSKGAAIRTAILSEYNARTSAGRDGRDGQERFVLLLPVTRQNGSEILSLANSDFIFIDEELKIRLDKLDWETSEIVTTDNSQSISFEAIIRGRGGKEVVKLTKIYTVMRGSYHLECDLKVENLAGDELKTQFKLQGPSGIKREGARIDARKIVGVFAGADGQTSGVVKEIMTPFTGKLRHKLGLRDASKEYELAQTQQDRNLARQREQEALEQLRIKHQRNDMRFLWAASSNKYFTAILRPVPEPGKLAADWIRDKTAWYYDFNKAAQGDETIGFSYTIDASHIEPGSARQYKFQLYLGPKDKSLFQKNELYRQLGFYHTITFMSCCCPANLVNPLAFGILALLKWMYGIIPNYGIVIIIFVFVVRLVLHPITKSSQVSMMKMQKLGPQVEQIKQQYAHNKAEMNKRVMALYKEQGAVPIMGCLPMLLQMPIWIALYSAIYASVDLRGAPFLPFWITDLSAPDAIVSFSSMKVPLLGNLQSLNLLPILLAVGMYLQQKLMPHPSSAQGATNPQAAQQQKMMQIMMPIMMLLFLYNAPSGLNLYIMASTFAGILEQYKIRKHREQLEEKEAEVLVDVTAKTGGKAKKKKPKPWIKY
jgi:YidC/Oxa1 family membrane protein insertase